MILGQWLGEVLKLGQFDIDVNVSLKMDGHILIESMEHITIVWKSKLLNMVLVNVADKDKHARTNGLHEIRSRDHPASYPCKVIVIYVLDTTISISFRGLNMN